MTPLHHSSLFDKGANVGLVWTRTTHATPDVAGSADADLL